MAITCFLLVLQAEKRRPKGSSQKVTEGKVHFDGDRSKLNEMQKSSLSIMEVLAKSLGIQFYVFESWEENGVRYYRDSNGEKAVAPNGWYDPSDGSIHIDLYAGNDGKGAMLFTAAHELSHFIRQWSPAKFKVLANLVLQQYGEQNIPVRELIDKQIAKAKRQGRTLSFDEAYEEVVADAMEAILIDGNVVQLMADMRAQDKTLWEKVRDWFKDLAQKLQAVVDAFRGVEPDSAEGKLVSEMQDMIVVLESFYADALMDAGENYGARTQKNTSDEGGGVKYSLLAFEKDGRKFVEIDQDQDRFDGHDPSEYPRIAKDIINEKFNGRVIGTINKMFVNGSGRDEFANPSKRIPDTYYEAKMRTAGELDNLLDAGTNFRNVPDGADGHVHDDVIDGFDYFDTLFKIGKRYYAAVINIKNVRRGKLFKDVTKIEDVTQDIMSSYGTNPKSQFLRTSSVSSILNPDEIVKPKMSTRDSAGRQLTEAQQEYFRDTQARDKDGNLLVLYHQTGGDFTIFDTRHTGAGSNDSGTPFGIFLKRSAGDIGLSGKKQMILYANIKNPLRVTNREYLDRELRKISDRYAAISDRLKNLDAEYQRKIEQAQAAWSDYVKKWREANPNGKRTDLYEDPKFNELFDAEDDLTEEWAAISNQLSAQAKEIITEDIRNAGYDGIFIEEDVGSWGRSTDAIIALDANQVKSVDNPNPTSNPDIRYSGRDTTISGGTAQKNTAEGGGVKYQARNLYDYSKSFAEQLKDYQSGRIPKGDTLVVGPTPDIFQKIGMTALPVTLNTTHVDYALNGTKDFDHHIGKDLLEQLPEVIKEPVAIMTSGTKANSSIVVMLEIRHNGKQIVVPVVIDGFGVNNGVRIDSNAITSVYGKNYSILKVLYDAIVQEVNGAFRLYYLDKNKATALLQGAKVLMPKMPATHDGGFINSLSDTRSPVKRRFFDVTETQQFKRWFGDWQKHPHNASKVVNADGTPKVVYHGSYSNFSVFDGNARKHSKAPQGTHFFTDDIDVGYSYTGYKNIASPGGHAYKGGIYPCYLNIRKPYVVDFKGKHWWEKVNGMDINDTAQYAKDNDYDGLIVYNIIDEGGQGDINWDESIPRKPATGYVVFSSEQIKSATDNIGTFDGSNPDIRYSTRGPAQQKTQHQLEQENETLREDVKYLREMLALQRKVTGGTKFTKTSVLAAARVLKQYAGAKGDTAELAGLLNAFYEGIATAQELTWEDVQEMAQPVVNWLQDHVDLKPQRSEYAQEILNAIRGRKVYLDENQMAEAEYRFGSYDTFRKSLMGSIVLSKNADMSLDSFWHEMSAQYPDVFSEDVSSSDMPGALFDIIASLRNSDTSVIEYAHNRDMIAQDLLWQVYDSYWNISTLRTVADSAQKKINALKGKHIRQMSELRAKKNAQIGRLKAAHRAELKAVRMEHRKDMDERIAAIKKKHQDSRDAAVDGRRRTQMRHKIQRVVKELNSLLLSDDKKRHVPDSMKKAVASALDLLELDTVNAEERLALYDDLIASEVQKYLHVNLLHIL